MAASSPGRKVTDVGVVNSRRAETEQRRGSERLPRASVLVCLAAIVLVVAVQARGAEKAAGAAGAAEVGPPEVREVSRAGVSFWTDRLTLWRGGTQVVAFRVKEVGEADRRIDASVSGEGVKIVRRAEVLAGREVGFVRVWVAPAASGGMKEGEVRLRVGEAEVVCDVRTSPLAGRMRETRPVIVTPVSGAAVWGKIAVGVELLEDPMQLLGEAAVTGRRVALSSEELEKARKRAEKKGGKKAAGAVSKDRWEETSRASLRGVVLRVGEGGDAREFEPMEVSSLDEGPVRRFVFEVDADAYKDATLRMEAVVKGGGGEVDAEMGKSEAVWLTRVEASKDRLMQGEAEGQVKVKVPEEVFNKEYKMPTGEDPSASGGGFAKLGGERTPVPIEINVKTAGWYQLMFLAKGVPGGNMMPVAAAAMGRNDIRTASPVLNESWARVPIGRPFRLKEGKQLLLPSFVNDFNSGSNNDRGLQVDRFELLRLEGSPRRYGEASDPTVERDLVVAFDRVLDGRTMSGDFVVEATVKEEAAGKVKPAVTLLLNGEAVETKHDDHPVFKLYRGQLQPGVNTLQLRGQVGELTAVSTVQHVELAALPKGATVPRPRRDATFGLDHRAWDGAGPGIVDDQPLGRRANFSSDGGWTLHLPEGLEGEFDVRITGGGDAYKGAAKVEVTLLQGDAKAARSTTVGEAGFSSRRQTQSVGPLTLEGGQHGLQIEFTNDLDDEKTKKGRNFWLYEVELVERGQEDMVAPIAEVLYPAKGAAVYGADAVVVRVADERGVRDVELLIDGETTGIRIEAADGDATVLLPVPLRGMAAGEHRVAARVRDGAGNAADSGEVAVNVLASPPTNLSKYERAVRLLDRFAYGPEPRELAAVLLEGEGPYLEKRLRAGFDDAGVREAWTHAVATYPDDRNAGQVIRRAIQHLLETPDPARGRAVMFLDNHFSTWLRKAEPARKAVEHEAFARLGPGPFEDLLFASATSPAMMLYLDQDKSLGRRINENYAREVMELHTLGVGGGYDQSDVTELANLLSGWRSDEIARPLGYGGYLTAGFRYDPHSNDASARRIFGVAYEDVGEATANRYDRARFALEVLASHPSTARFIATKLTEHYLADRAPDAVVDELAQVYLRTGGDVREMILTLARRPEGFGRDATLRMAQPLDFAVRTLRIAGADDANRATGYLQAAGFGLFDRDTPDGYPQDDESYADSNAMLQRWKFGQGVDYHLARLLPETLRDPPTISEGDDPAATAIAQQRWRQRVIDVLAVRLTGGLLSDRSNEAAHDVLSQTDKTGHDRIRLIAGLIAQLPEASLR